MQQEEILISLAAKSTIMTWESVNESKEFSSGRNGIQSIPSVSTLTLAA